MLNFTCLNNDKSKVRPDFDGQMIRSAYLLGDNVTVAGSGYYNLSMEKFWYNPTPGVKKKLLLDFCKNDSNPEILEQVKDLYRMMSEVKQKLKHEPKEIIVMRKRTQKTLDNIYDEYLKQTINAFMRSGYLGLQPLIDDKEIVLAGLDLSMPESTENNATPFSELMKDYWEKRTDGYAFTSPFWEFAEKEGIEVRPAEEAGTGTGVLTFPLSEFPPLFTLTAGELKVIKQQVFGPMLPARKAIEEWVLTLIPEDYDASHFKRHADYYRQHVGPLAGEARQRAESHPLLQKMRDQFQNQILYESCLAICPGETVWRFMEWSGIVPEESAKVFRENLPEGCTPKKSVLLFLNKPLDHRKNVEDGDKKSLRL